MDNFFLPIKFIVLSVFSILYDFIQSLYPKEIQSYSILIILNMRDSLKQYWIFRYFPPTNIFWLYGIKSQTIRCAHILSRVLGTYEDIIAVVVLTRSYCIFSVPTFQWRVLIKFYSFTLLSYFSIWVYKWVYTLILKYIRVRFCVNFHLL